MRAVATLESVNLHWHLLAFQTGRNTTHEHHRFDVVELLDEIAIIYRLLLRDVDLHACTPGLHMSEADLNLVAPACLGHESGASGSGTPCVLLHLLLAVDRHREVAHALNRHHVLAALRGGELSLI